MTWTGTLLDFDNDPDFKDPKESRAGFEQTKLNALFTLVYKNTGLIKMMFDQPSGT